MSERLARNDLLMIRMAAEGVPIAAIARVACVSASLALVTLQAAKARGHLAELPAEDWLNATNFKPEGAANPLPVQQILALAEEISELGLSAQEARLAAALAVVGLVGRPEAHLIVCGDRSVKPKIIDVVLCKVRKKLRPYGCEIETLWGRGYRMNEPSRLRLMAAVGTLEARRAS